jgi:hypothetical protein
MFFSGYMTLVLFIQSVLVDVGFIYSICACACACLLFFLINTGVDMWFMTFLKY